MYSPSLALAAFNGTFDWDLSNEILDELFEMWTRIAERWIRRDRTIPMLYQSNVRYYACPFWEGPWLDPKTAAARGWADCKSLACWRAAELRVHYGIQARCRYERRLVTHGKVTEDLIHVFVEYPDGRTEDPSRETGMPG